MTNPKEITDNVLAHGCPKCNAKSLKSRMWVEKITLHKSERQAIFNNTMVIETYEVVTNCMYSHSIKLYSFHSFDLP